MTGGAALGGRYRHSSKISNSIFPSLFSLHQCLSHPPHHVCKAEDFGKITFPFSPYQDLNPICVDILVFIGENALCKVSISLRNIKLSVENMSCFGELS